MSNIYKITEYRDNSYRTVRFHESQAPEVESFYRGAVVANVTLKNGQPKAVPLDFLFDLPASATPEDCFRVFDVHAKAELDRLFGKTGANRKKETKNGKK